MRKILQYLKDYQRKHFDLKLYLLVGLFLTVCIAFNYYFDFEDSVIDLRYGTPWHWVWMMPWHAFPYVGVCVIFWLYGLNRSWISSGGFWLRILIGFSILALERAFYGTALLQNYLNYVDYRFIAKCINWSSSLIITVIPLLLICIMIEKEHPRIYYGMAWKRFRAKPYFLLLGIAVVCIGIGSFLSEIQNYYPRFQFSGGNAYAEKNDLPLWVSVLLYELAYGSDFISVELFFRGFLIHAFVRMLGGHAVLPMVAAYAFLHFGKPLAETISSIFGGYILGIVSYYTRSIWGGIIIHMGVAWAMELFGFLQKLL